MKSGNIKIEFYEIDYYSNSIFMLKILNETRRIIQNIYYLAKAMN